MRMVSFLKSYWWKGFWSGLELQGIDIHLCGSIKRWLPDKHHSCFVWSPGFQTHRIQEYLPKSQIFRKISEVMKKTRWTSTLIQLESPSTLVRLKYLAHVTTCSGYQILGQSRLWNSKSGYLSQNYPANGELPGISYTWYIGDTVCLGWSPAGSCWTANGIRLKRGFMKTGQIKPVNRFSLIGKICK